MSIDLRACRKRVVAVFPDGATADVTAACTGLARDDNSGELAQRLTVEADGTVPVGDRGPLYRVLVPWVRLILSASTDDGATWTETFRGAITDWQLGSDGVLTLTAYDDLIFLTRSDDAFTFTAGQSGADVLRAILGSAVLPAAIDTIDGPTVAMPKLALQGRLSEMVMQVLQHALAIGDKAYWVRMRAGKLEVVVPGGNGPRHALTELDGVSDWTERRTTDDVASEVQVLGATREGDDQQRPVLATAAADGGLQAANVRIVAQLDGQQYDTPAKAQAAADLELERRRMPATTRTATTLGVPWLRRGDLVRLRAGTADGLVQAAGIAWDEDDDTMVLTVAEQGTPLYQAKKIEEQAVAEALGPTAAPVVAGGKRAALLAWARAHLGTPYTWAGGHPGLIGGGWDCSGYVDHAYAAVGVGIGWDGTGGMEGNPQLVRVSNPIPGDIVLFPGHVGIVAGGDRMYNASSPGVGTIVSSISRSAASHGGGPDYRRVVALDR